MTTDYPNSYVDINVILPAIRLNTYLVGGPVKNGVGFFNVARLGDWMAFRVIDSETGKIIMDAGDITSLIATIEELGDQYEVKQLDIH